MVNNNIFSLRPDEESIIRNSHVEPPEHDHRHDHDRHDFQKTLRNHKKNKTPTPHTEPPPAKPSSLFDLSKTSHVKNKVLDKNVTKEMDDEENSFPNERAGPKEEESNFHKNHQSETIDEEEVENTLSTEKIDIDSQGLLNTPKTSKKEKSPESSFLGKDKNIDLSKKQPDPGLSLEKNTKTSDKPVEVAMDKTSLQEEQAELPQVPQPQVIDKSPTPPSSLPIRSNQPPKELLESQKNSSVSPSSKKIKSSEDNSSEDNKFISKIDKSKRNSRAQTDNIQERGALAAVNSPIQSVNFQMDKSEILVETSRSSVIKELVTQIVERIQTMRKGDETQTMITLRHPPLLAGSTINLVTSNAKREFKISFANLSPEAKKFLDDQLKENSLPDALERKGIIVHTITTTTQPENLIYTAANPTPQDQQQQQEQRQQQRQQQQEESHEE